MKTLIRWLIVIGVVGGGLYFAASSGQRYLAERRKVTFETQPASVGAIESLVRSTGEVRPVLEVSVGSFVSGPVTELHVDFNDRVAKGDLLAEVDPRLFEAAVERDRASLATRQADRERVEAQLQQARNDERRATQLRLESADYISQAEVDRAHFARLSLEAQLKVAEAGIDQARATLENSVANLNYTRIEAPVDGIVIDRKIDPGQTLASQFQTPELFTIAPQMRETMHIFATVDEADIGLLREAQDDEQPVRFTVTAYPKKEFEGRIEQIRFSPTELQNVVTYPVVIATPNPDLELLPGMTAELSFRLERREDVLRVPNAALRYVPEAKLVREEDRYLVSGGEQPEQGEEEEVEKVEAGSAEAGSIPAGPMLATGEQEEADDADKDSEEDSDEEDGADDDLRHVWVRDGELLRAIAVRTGITDGKFTEIVDIEGGPLEAGDELVVGVK